MQFYDQVKIDTSDVTFEGTEFSTFSSQYAEVPKNFLRRTPYVEPRLADQISNTVETSLPSLQMVFIVFQDLHFEQICKPPSVLRVSRASDESWALTSTVLLRLSILRRSRPFRFSPRESSTTIWTDSSIKLSSMEIRTSRTAWRAEELVRHGSRYENCVAYRVSV